jgi:choice-of-anchor A domain-containing protein
MRALLLSLFLFLFHHIYSQNPLAPAAGFNVFVEKNAWLTTNETDGPVAIGCNLTINGNYQVATNYTGSYVIGGIPVGLVVDGKVVYNAGLLQVNSNCYAKIGDQSGSVAWYRDLNNAASPIRITNGNNYNSSSRIQLQANAIQLGVSATVNPVFAKTSIKFSTAFNTLKTNSCVLSVCNNNVQLTTSNGIPISNNNLPSQIKINLQNGVNVLNLNGSDLNRAQQITFNHQPSASKVLIINVDAGGTFNWEVWNQAGIGFSNCPYILYNFYNTKTLNIKGNSTIEGSILAPNADIVKTVNQANIEGQVIAQSLTHSGGEIHYAPFAASPQSCAISTSAAFTVNNSAQCIYNNSFQFASSNIGTAPFTYFWDFGDGTFSNASSPTKVYTTPGNYTVKHVLTGLAGKDSTVQQVVVSGKPIIGFTINDSIQEITGNNFVYTTTNYVNGYSYEWRYGDGSTYGITPNTSRTYQATGPYFVCQIVTNTIGCKDTAFAWVVVTSDSVGSGNGGGLESESLGGLVGLREFNKSKHSIPRKVNYSNSPVFVSQPHQLGKRTSSLSLMDMIPSTLATGDVARVTSPTDLVNITSALEVISVDYTRNNVPKAVVLGIKTKTKAYSHTKYICDRLKGATLISIDSVTIKGYQFIRYLLQQQDGSMEFGTSFVVGKTDGRADYSLQTNWLLADMIEEDTLYNFQVWSSLPENTNKLVADIIDLINSGASVNQLNEVTVPKVYVTKGYRKGSKLVLHFRNLTSSPKAIELAMEERLNEQANLTQRNYNHTIERTEDKAIELIVNDGYEYSANIIIDTFTTDVIYMADGNWGLDYDRNYTTITNYNTNNEPTRIYSPSALSVYRHASVTAITDDYIMMFKGLVQGNAPANLTSFSHVTFFASGTGKAVLTLVRDSIERWKSQYYITVDLTPEGKIYNIPFSDFKSDSLSSVFNPNDVRTLAFSRGYQATSGLETIDLSIGGVAFVPTSTALINKQLVSSAVGVKPNPSTGSFTVSFKSNATEQANIKITDVLGKTIYTFGVNIVNGENQLPLDISSITQQNGILFLTVESKSSQYNTVKIIINN